VDAGFIQDVPSSCVTNTDSGFFYGTPVTDPNDSLMHLLLDVNGIIAGIQAWFPHDEVLTPENEYRYGNVAMYQNITVNGRTFFVVTAYFVEPSIICEGGRTEESLTTEGTGTGLWFQNGPTPADLIQVPMNRADAEAEGWSHNSCFPGMGRHNFFQVDKFEETGCLETRPAFILYNKQDEMTGFGFTAQGVAASARWVEHPPNLAIELILGEPVPQCVLDQNTLVGTTTMHVYFVDHPWNFNCL